MNIQRLRCKANFQALIFVPHIRALGDSLVSRLRYPSSEKRALDGIHLHETTNRQQPLKFVVIHLRFDKVWPMLVGLKLGWFYHLVHKLINIWEKQAIQILLRILLLSLFLFQYLHCALFGNPSAGNVGMKVWYLLWSSLDYISNFSCPGHELYHWNNCWVHPGDNWSILADVINQMGGYLCSHISWLWKWLSFWIIFHLNVIVKHMIRIYPFEVHISDQMLFICDYAGHGSSFCLWFWWG